MAATEQWLVENHLTFDEWGAMLEGGLLARRVRKAVTGKKIEPYFAQHRLDFDRATISRLVVAQEGLARELRAQIVDEDAAFHALARRHSTEAATRPMGGYAGEVKRGDLPAALQAEVFGGQPGDVVGRPDPRGLAFGDDRGAPPPGPRRGDARRNRGAAFRGVDRGAAEGSASTDRTAGGAVKCGQSATAFRLLLPTVMTTAALYNRLICRRAATSRAPGAPAG